MFGRIKFANVSRFDDIIGKAITISIDVFYDDDSASYGIFCVDVGNGLRFIGEFSSCVSNDIFESIARNIFLYGDVVIPNVSRFDDIIGKTITVNINVFYNDDSASYGIFCVDVGNGLRLIGEFSSCVSNDIFESIARNIFLFGDVVIPNVSRFDDIIGKTITIRINVFYGDICA